MSRRYDNSNIIKQTYQSYSCDITMRKPLIPCCATIKFNLTDIGGDAHSIMHNSNHSKKESTKQKLFIFIMLCCAV